MDRKPDEKMVKELLLQALEHERGGMKIYDAALKCAVNEDLKEEWGRYRQETERHAGILQDVCSQMQIDAEAQTPGRKITHDKGMALVASMEAALGAGDPQAAQCVAAEAVTEAEMIDHFNWELIGQVAKAMSGPEGRALKEAYKEVEDQEDEHFYHSRGWLRELSLEGLGLKAVLPPPEEKKHVKTAIGAARAEQQRKHMR